MSYTANSPLLAPSTVDSKQPYLWLCNHALTHASEYSSGDFASIVHYYYHYAEETGLDPLLALAQCVHETGGLTSWWAGRPRRNFAGIGVSGHTLVPPEGSPTDPADPDFWRPADEEGWEYHAERGLWEAGCTFGSVREAVRKHVGRLLAYALHDEEANEAQLRLIKEALDHRGLPARFRGAAPTIKGLVGRWATDPRYVTKLVNTANMLATYQPKK